MLKMRASSKGISVLVVTQGQRENSSTGLLINGITYFPAYTLPLFGVLPWTFSMTVHEYISGDGSFQRTLPEGRKDKTGPSFVHSSLQFPSVIPDALKPQAPLHTFLLYPRGMTKSPILHPRVVYGVKDKIEETSQCRHQYQTRIFSAVSPLPCHFHYEKYLEGLIWDSHFTVQQQ